MSARCGKKQYFICPYCFMLVCVLMILLFIANGIMFAIWIHNTHGMSVENAIMTADAFGCALVFACTLGLAIIFLSNSFEYFGTVSLFSDRLVFQAPLRKPKVFIFAEIKDVGIDYGIVSGQKQLWIYFSKTLLPKEYVHRIVRLPYSENAMRIQYRKELYEDLIRNVSYETVGKKLRRSISAVRLHQEDC